MSNKHRIRIISALLDLCDVELDGFARTMSAAAPRKDRHKRHRNPRTWARSAEQLARLDALVTKGKRQLVELALRKAR